MTSATPAIVRRIENIAEPIYPQVKFTTGDGIATKAARDKRSRQTQEQ